MTIHYKYSLVKDDLYIFLLNKIYCDVWSVFGFQVIRMGFSKLWQSVILSLTMKYVGSCSVTNSKL